jgi:spoIIIJ-associated protein
LQFVANRVVNRPGKTRRHVIIDAEGYRARREDALTSMARRLGKQAVDEGKIITFEPMSPQDRRVVHLALAKFPGVVTKSDGEGESRRVQIIPVRR